MISNPSEHTILVTGATGQQGSGVARHLLERGFPVRVLTRDPEQEAAQALSEQGAEVVQGDFGDRSSLDRALADAYGAYSVQNTWAAGPEGEIRHGKAFADAAKAAGVEHFVYSSVGSADQDTGIPHFDSKFEIEEHIRAVELPHTILRPVFFMNNWEQAGREGILEEGTLAQPLSPDTSLQQIAVDDIGAFAALAFANPDQWLGRAVDLAGDEPTMRETAATFSRVTGQDVRYVQVSWDQFRENAGEEMTVMYKWFEDVGYKADIAALREEYPELARLELYLRRHGWEEASTPAS